MRAIVVGGGIGGLATALALRHGGWQVEVRERSGSLDRGGAGLVLWPNALRCLRVLGIEDAVRSRGATLTGSSVRRTDGRLLSSVITADRPLGIVRADLVDALASALGADAVTFEAEVRVVTDLDADLVVGADGVRSVVRASMGSTVSPGFRGYTVWRALVPRAPGTPELSETWGPGLRFGMVPAGREATYVYAAAPAAEGERCADERDELARRFGAWHAPVPAVLAAIEPGSLLRHDIYDLPPGRTQLHAGRLVLVGDAGHAMEPNLGQGAGLALEDALVLAHALATEELDVGLAAYAGARGPRVTALARQSRRIGRLARISHPTAVAMRDLAMRSTPDRIARRAMGAATDWSPPTPQESR